MKQRPILFSAPMVRAILDGRKTQTRRLLSPQPLFTRDMVMIGGRGVVRTVEGRTYTDEECVRGLSYLCPYGVVGDRLWVRETWAALDRDGEDPDVLYRADYLPGTGRYTSPCNCGWCDDGEEHAKWRPSIHMPRWASRITLEVTGVRVERLQGLSEADALAEGPLCTTKPSRRLYRATESDAWEDDPRDAFRRIWERVNYKREGAAWVSNPWVWVVDFKRIEQ